MNPEFLITIDELKRSATSYALLDVRKAHARKASSATIPGSRSRSIFNAEDWWRDYRGQRPLLFCVHGHEVSQAGCGFLRDHGVEAYFLEGGFEAWRAAGLPVVPIGASDQ